MSVSKVQLKSRVCRLCPRPLRGWAVLVALRIESGGRRDRLGDVGALARRRVGRSCAAGARAADVMNVMPSFGHRRDLIVVGFGV